MNRSQWSVHDDPAAERRKRIACHCHSLVMQFVRGWTMKFPHRKKLI